MIEIDPGLRRAILASACILSLAGPAVAQLSPQMRAGIANAKPVPVYSATERTNTLQRILKRAAPPVLGASVSLTPNAPYAPDGARLSFWKPSFILGTAGGGEAGINFWGGHNGGHVNVAFTSRTAKSSVLDCRILSAGRITYKIYGGGNGILRDSSEAPLIESHLMLVVPVAGAGDPISVELWPSPATEIMGFLGCDLSPIE